MALSASRGAAVHCGVWGVGPRSCCCAPARVRARDGSGPPRSSTSGAGSSPRTSSASARPGAWPRPGELIHHRQADLVAALVEDDAGGAVDVVGHSYGGATAVHLVLRRPELVRSLVLVEPLLCTLLRDAGDPLFDECRCVAEGFIGHARAGQGGKAWSLSLDYRNGPGTWAGVAEKARARFLNETAQTAEGVLSNLSNPTTLDDCRRIAAGTRRPRTSAWRNRCSTPFPGATTLAFRVRATCRHSRTRRSLRGSSWTTWSGRAPASRRPSNRARRRSSVSHTAPPSSRSSRCYTAAWRAAAVGA